MIRRLMPGDFFIMLIYIALFLLFLFLSLQNIGATGSLLVQSSGVEYRYDPDEARILELEGPIGRTVIEIDGEGRARFVYSDCRDQICVSSGYLAARGEWAACLPNRIIARMDRQLHHQHEENEIDAGSY